MSDNSLGKELITAIEDALASKESGNVVRPNVDVTAIRRNLKLTQKQFASRYRINIETLRNWEQQKRIPDTTSLAYLTCITKRPNLIRSLVGDA